MAQHKDLHCRGRSGQNFEPFFRNSASADLSGGDERARISAASTAAFFAPAEPIATVATGMPGGHLDDRIERVEPLQRRPLKRNTDHGERRQRRGEPREMRCHPGRRDHQRIAFPLRLAHERGRLLGLPVRGRDDKSVLDAEFAQVFGAGVHRLLIGFAAEKHKDARHGQTFAV